jgi:hypothetical protein
VEDEEDGLVLACLDLLLDVLLVLLEQTGCSFTFPGLYTPWTLPKPAAMEKYGEMGDRVL